MKRYAKFFVLLLVLAVPFAIYAAKKRAMMRTEKSVQGTWIGWINGNKCSAMGMKCAPSHAKSEMPVFVPEVKGKPDFKHFYTLTGENSETLKHAFLMEVKVTGTLYPASHKLAVKTMLVKEGRAWAEACCYKGSSCCPHGKCCMTHRT